VKQRWGAAAVGEGEMGSRPLSSRGNTTPSAWGGHVAAGCRERDLLLRPPPEGHGEGESRSDPPAEGKGRCGQGPPPQGAVEDAAALAEAAAPGAPVRGARSTREGDAAVETLGAC
jgi:hypothetical protein